MTRSGRGISEPGQPDASLRHSVPMIQQMYRRTFERLQREHDAHVNAALAGMAAKLGLLRGWLEDIDAAFDRLD